MGFGKKRGRKEDSTEFERRRLTASATFLVFRILGGFEQQITELKTKFDKFVNSRAAGRRRRCVPGWSGNDAPLGTARCRSCTSSRKKNVIANQCSHPSPKPSPTGKVARASPASARRMRVLPLPMGEVPRQGRRGLVLPSQSASPPAPPKWEPRGNGL